MMLESEENDLKLEDDLNNSLEVEKINEQMEMRIEDSLEEKTDNSREDLKEEAE
jgi:hypothetical protein